MSAFSNLFSAASWRGGLLRAGVVARSGIKAVGRGARASWSGIKGFVRRYPNFTSALAAGTGVSLIARAFSSAGETAAAEDQKRMLATGTDSGEAAQKVDNRSALNALRNGVISIGSVGPIDRNSRRDFLKFVGAYHKFMHSHLDGDTREFMITADQMIGSMARCGVCPEEGFDTDTFARALLNIKDDEEPGSSIQADLINVLLVDQTQTPLKTF